MDHMNPANYKRKDKKALASGTKVDLILFIVFIRNKKYKNMKKPSISSNLPELVIVQINQTIPARTKPSFIFPILIN